MSVRLAKSNDTPAPRDPLRQALAAAISNHAELTAALAENQASQRRADDARFAANRAVDAAIKALEEAKVSDAEAIATGTAGGAVKAARVALTDAEDAVAAATKAAGTMLSDRNADLSNRLSISSMRVNDAVAAVIHKCPQVRELIEQFRVAQLALHEMLEATRALTPQFPPASNNVWWEASGLPSYARFWDNVDWEKDLPPSATAARVAQWIDKLRQDADAVL